MPVLAELVSDLPEPWVPSDIVQCAGCGADCWLSKYSGQSTLALAATLGDARIFCASCLMKEGNLV